MKNTNLFKLFTLIALITIIMHANAQTIDAVVTTSRIDSLSFATDKPPCPVMLTPQPNEDYCPQSVPILATACSGTTNSLANPNSGIVYGVYLYDDGAGNNEAPPGVELTTIPPGAEFPSFPQFLGFPTFLALSQGCDFPDPEFSLTNNTCDPKVYSFIYLIYDFDLDLNLDGTAEYIPNCPIERFDYTIYPGFTATIGSFNECGDVTVNLNSGGTICNVQQSNCKDDGDPSSVSIEPLIDVDGTVDGMGTLVPIDENPNGTCNTFTVECPVTPLIDAGESGTICPGEIYELEVSYEDMTNPMSDGSYTVTVSPQGSCTATPSGAINEVFLNDDDFSSPIPLGFNFDFWGNSYSDFYINSNGYVSFGSGSTIYTNEPIPSPSNPNNLIALFWADLLPSIDYFYPYGNISYFTSVINGQTCMVVQFNMIPYCCMGYYNSTITGQIIMCPDGTIIINCIDCQESIYGGVATSGIENADGSEGAFNPNLTNGQYVNGGSYTSCTTFTPNIATPSTCNFLYWVTDLNDPTNSIVSTNETATVNPAITTTYYAIVECDNGLQCLDEVTVTIDNDPNNCEPPPTCVDEIAGSVQTDDADCNLEGIMVLITDATGNPVGIAITDVNGDYMLSSGPYLCGEYIATLDVASVPACYLDVDGEIGPKGFTVNGDGIADGANFSSFNEVPTLSQWGLIVLVLLLMNLGALKMNIISENIIWKLK